MTIHVCRACRKNCWNHRDTYGEICIGCGCCSADKKERYESRIHCLEEWIKEELNFNMWDDDPEWRKTQERNRASNLYYYRSRLYYYRRMMKKMQNEL